MASKVNIYFEGDSAAQAVLGGYLQHLLVLEEQGRSAKEVGVGVLNGGAQSISESMQFLSSVRAVGGFIQCDTILLGLLKPEGEFENELLQALVLSRHAVLPTDVNVNVWCLGMVPYDFRAPNLRFSGSTKIAMAVYSGENLSRAAVIPQSFTKLFIVSVVSCRFRPSTEGLGGVAYFFICSPRNLGKMNSF